MPPERIIDSNDLALVIRDGYPISPGHSLVIPKRHIGSWFETTPEEQSAMLNLLERAKALLEESTKRAESLISIHQAKLLKIKYGI
jgi:diadenosine tetraphosphate (Ap4A) HIT family hydrolase